MRFIVLVVIFLTVMLNANATPPHKIGPQIRSLVVAANGDLIALGNRGIYRSTDDGLNWIKVSDNAGAILLLQGEDILTVDVPGSIFRSKDAGLYWKYAGKTVDVPWADEIIQGSVSNLSIDGNGTCYVCANAKSLQISNDGGASWRQANGLNECYGVAADKNDIYVLGMDSLLRSSDGGLHWSNISEISTETKKIFRDNIVRFIKISEQGNLYAAGYESIDGGMSWQRKNFGIPEELAPRVVRFDSGVAYIVAGGTEADRRLSAYLSIDGSPAKQLEIPYTGSEFTVKKDHKLFLMTDGNIYKTTNGGASWSMLDKREMEE